jgi:ketosteroid isomerase-like protein
MISRRPASADWGHVDLEAAFFLSPRLDIPRRCGFNLPLERSRDRRLDSHDCARVAMKLNLVVALLGLLLLGHSNRSLAQHTNGETEKAVAALENQWFEADRTNNPDLIEPLLAERYVSTGMDGKVEDRAQTLATARARKYTTAELDDLRVTVFGDTAIATGTYRGRGTDAGLPFAEFARWTDTWVKMPDGKWRCVASQYTTIQKQ